MSDVDELLLQVTGSQDAADRAKWVAVEAAKAGMTAGEVPDAVRAYHLLRMFDMTYDEARKILHIAAIERAGGWDAVRESADDMGFDASAWRNPADG